MASYVDTHRRSIAQRASVWRVRGGAAAGMCARLLLLHFLLHDYLVLEVHKRLENIRMEKRVADGVEAHLEPVEVFVEADRKHLVRRAIFEVREEAPAEFLRIIAETARGDA